jgi:ATP-dependent Lon protease
VCKKIVEDSEKTDYNLEPDDLKDYLGVPIFSSQRLYPTDMPHGISIGLGYNSIGGSILFIETCQSSFNSQQDKNDESKEDNENKKSNQKNGSIIFTGSLGDVMKESVEIAHTFAKNFCFENFGVNFIEENDIHIHFPEGASKKDGPSAGITITSAFVSLATGKPISGEIGMTGEISLNGKILKIGGLREKILAAKREGLKEIIVPWSNKIDVEELSDNIVEGVKFHYVQRYDEVSQILFGK